MGGKGKALFQNTLIYTVGTFGSKVITFLLFPLLSFYLTKEEVGAYDLVVTTVSLFIPIITIQLSDANYRWIITFGKDPQALKKVISTNLFTVTGLLLAFLLLIIVVQFFVTIPYVFYFMGFIAGMVFFQFLQQTVRGLGFNKKYAGYAILNAFFIFTFSGLFLLVLKTGVEGVLWASILAYSLSSLIIFFHSKIYERLSFSLYSGAELKEMIRYSYPLIPNSISWWLINLANRYIILFFLSAELNGIYAISARFPAIIIMVNSIFTLAWQDHTIKEESDIGFSSRVFNRFVKMEFGLVLVLIAMSELLARYLVDENFYEAWRYMPVLFLATAFTAFSAYYGAVYLRQKNTKELFFSTLLGGIINLVISIALIGTIGLLAPAIGTFFGFMVVFGYRVWQNRKTFQLDIDKMTFFGLFVLSLIFLGLKGLGNVYVDVILIVISLVVFVKINLSTFYKFYSYIKK